MGPGNSEDVKMFSLHPFLLGSCPPRTESSWTDPTGPQFPHLYNGDRED